MAELLRSGRQTSLGRLGRRYPAADALLGAKIVPGALAMLRVAAALPKGRSEEAQAVLATFVDEAKRIAAESDRPEGPQGGECRDEAP
ncbi:hypothetical protein [Bradyrhizobium sp. STM 3562]|uniref:hypothetical protein n=1 Tax=Bradyrhizobium sp. STM 3562 TaxID=578924 RepID=UPI00388ED08E